MTARLLLFLFTLAAASGSAATAPKDIVSLSLRRSVSGEYQLVVRNESAKPIWYAGYGEEGGMPYYTVEILRGQQWEKVQLGWCGVGLGESRLASLQQLVLHIGPGMLFEISPGERFRVSVAFSSEKHVSSKRVDRITFHSNPIVFIPANEKRANPQPEPIRAKGPDRSP